MSTGVEYTSRDAQSLACVLAVHSLTQVSTTEAYYRTGLEGSN